MNNIRNGQVYEIKYNGQVLYVGSTWNIMKRNSSHLTNCYDETSKQYNYAIYKYIRDNNISWSDLEFIVVYNGLFASKNDRFLFEESYMLLLNPICNSMRAKGRTRKEYYEENKETILNQQKQHYEENKEEIHKERKKYYEENKETILNQQKQHYEENKEEFHKERKKYRAEHKEQISEQNRNYRGTHKEEIKEYIKDYQTKNKDKLCDYNKKRYQAKKDEIMAKRKKREVCECGSTYRHDCQAIHERSLKHQQYINSIL